MPTASSTPTDRYRHRRRPTSHCQNPLDLSLRYEHRAAGPALSSKARKMALDLKSDIGYPLSSGIDTLRCRTAASSRPSRAMIFRSQAHLGLDNDHSALPRYLRACNARLRSPSPTPSPASTTAPNRAHQDWRRRCFHQKPQSSDPPSLTKSRSARHRPPPNTLELPRFPTQPTRSGDAIEKQRLGMYIFRTSSSLFTRHHPRFPPPTPSPASTTTPNHAAHQDQRPQPSSKTSELRPAERHQVKVCSTPASVKHARTTKIPVGLNVHPYLI